MAAWIAVKIKSIWISNNWLEILKGKKHSDHVGGVLRIYNKYINKTENEQEKLMRNALYITNMAAMKTSHENRQFVSEIWKCVWLILQIMMSLVDGKGIRICNYPVE